MAIPCFWSQMPWATSNEIGASSPQRVCELPFQKTFEVMVSFWRFPRLIVVDSVLHTGCPSGHATSSPPSANLWSQCFGFKGSYSS